MDNESSRVAASSPWLTKEEIDGMGFCYVGKSVLISRKASVYGATRIRISDNCRIDDFCLLSAGAGGINIGRNVHVSAMTSIVGAAEIEIADFCGLSGKCSIYSSSDDYLGYALTNPTVPEKYRRVKNLPVRLGKHVIVGASSVLLPGAVLEEGVAVGASSVVSGRLEGWGVYLGNPARKVLARKRYLLDLEQQYLENARDS